MKPIVKGAIFYADLGNNIGSEENGTRPVLILQNDIGNKFSPTTIVAPISTKKNNKLPTHILIKQFDKVRNNSIIMLEQVRVIDKTRLTGFVDFLNEEQLYEVENALRILFDFSKEYSNNNVHNF